MKFSWTKSRIRTPVIKPSQIRINPKSGEINLLVILEDVP